jgi:hypothetical protein
MWDDAFALHAFAFSVILNEVKDPYPAQLFRTARGSPAKNGRAGMFRGLPAVSLGGFRVGVFSLASSHICELRQM